MNNSCDTCNKIALLHGIDVCLLLLVPLENSSLIWRRLSSWWRAAKSRPVIDRKGSLSCHALVSVFAVLSEKSPTTKVSVLRTYSNPDIHGARGYQLLDFEVLNDIDHLKIYGFVLLCWKNLGSNNIISTKFI